MTGNSTARFLPKRNENLRVDAHSTLVTVTTSGGGPNVNQLANG
jgi:hypothetical protein